MTDEEMAKEYAEGMAMYYESAHGSVPSQFEKYLKKAYLAGLEAGRTNWYKPSEKLPEECSLVLAYLFDETEPTICEYVTSNQWECLPRRIVFCSNDQVRKWKEIALSKES